MGDKTGFVRLGHILAMVKTTWSYTQSLCRIDLLINEVGIQGIKSSEANYVNDGITT